MTTIQALAAEMADVRRLVIHTGDRTGDEVAGDVRSLLRDDLGGTGQIAARILLGQLAQAGFVWGESNGN